MGGTEDSAPWIRAEDELVCLGHGEDVAAQQGALAPPVVLTSLFAQEDFDCLVASLDREVSARVYSRGNNPTVSAVESKIATLERAESARCFGSGMGAVHAALAGLVRSGDHVVFAGQTYGPTLKLARSLERFRVEHTLVPSVTAEAVSEALRPQTRVLWMESPSTMVFQRFHLGEIVELARSRSDRRPIVTVVDNSWATPLFQKPVLSGVDLVLHSATKYIGGHSDVVAGVLAGPDRLMEPLFDQAYLLGGAVLGPWEAWLLNRGLRTLPARMRAHHHGGVRVARFLEEQPQVRRVFHPVLAGGPEDPSRQPGGLSGWSGLFSFELAVDEGCDGAAFAAVRAFLDALECFRIGVSWGGVESLAIAPARPDNRRSLAVQDIPYGTVRLSVGLEPPDVLCADLEQALRHSGVGGG